MADAQDPVGYRRGLVLGLTLAETLLLVLFLLLLVYAALLMDRDKRIKEQQHEIAELGARFDTGLKELVVRLQGDGSSSVDPRDLSLRLEAMATDLSRLDTAEKQLEVYQQLVPNPADAERIVASFDKMSIADSPQDLLERRISDEQQKAGGATPPPIEPTTPKSGDDPKTLPEALATLDRVRGQLDYFQKIATQKEGNGLTLPPCWERDGQIVYSYDALLLDDGLQLTVGDARFGMDMSALQRNGPEPPTDSLISPQTFIDYTRGMFDWSQAQKCRFYVRIYDGTSSNNKSGYKQKRSTVENHFYIRVID